MRARLGVVLIVGCALLTWQRAPVWISNEALWTAAVVVTPSLPRPLINLAAAYAQQGQSEEADRWLQRAVATRRLTPVQRRDAARLRRFLCVTADRC